MPRQWLLPMIESNAVTLWREDASRADDVLTKSRGVERRGRTSRPSGNAKYRGSRVQSGSLLHREGSHRQMSSVRSPELSLRRENKQSWMGRWSDCLEVDANLWSRDLSIIRCRTGPLVVK
ncbi:hypothetical protein M431DRAFT_456823 [Trichoderma harzianum CBS 226.95]|uniref:Uncharacterized protein n=1 Tax=Trichoderma harzianum CBS 226.95 TaxID=983964 RepID=A0A2T4A7K6_TRIHA|nr:hypothetical protein M431DRAFT_456823 [Trichoderma harzianum CBS 226.95]PTB53050.1 hypothetical protein M431DRAFT_456823 [Trichoderma harzianum CBS 226.95]